MNSGHKMCLLLCSVFWCLAVDVCDRTSKNHRSAVTLLTKTLNTETNAIQAVDCNILSRHGDDISAEYKNIHSESCKEHLLLNSHNVQYTQLNCLNPDLVIHHPVCCHHQHMCHCICEDIQSRVRASKPRHACVCEELSVQHPCHIAKICFYPPDDNKDVGHFINDVRNDIGDVRNDIGDVPLRGADVQYSCDCMLVVSDMNLMSEHSSSQTNERRTVVYITKNSSEEIGCGASSFISSMNNLSQENFIVLEGFDESKGKHLDYTEHNLLNNYNANRVIQRCQLASGKVRSMLLDDGQSSILKMIRPPSDVRSQDMNPVCISLMLKIFLSLPSTYTENITFLNFKDKGNIYPKVQRNLKNFQVLVNINNDVVSLKLERSTKVQVAWNLATCNLSSFLNPGEDFIDGDCRIESCNTEDAFFMTEGNKCKLTNAVVVKTYNRQIQLSRNEQIQLSDAVNCFLQSELRLDILNEYWPLHVGLLAHVVTLVSLVHDVGHPDIIGTQKRMRDIVTNLSVIDLYSTLTQSATPTAGTETCGCTFVLPKDASSQMFWNKYKSCSFQCVTNVERSSRYKELTGYTKKKSQFTKCCVDNALCGCSAFRFYLPSYFLLQLFFMYSL